MITKQESKILKEELGRFYIDEVLQVLKDRKVLSIQGEPHKKSFISLVLSGKRDNDDVVDALYEVLRRRKIQREKRANRRMNIFKNL